MYSKIIKIMTYVSIYIDLVLKNDINVVLITEVNWMKNNSDIKKGIIMITQIGITMLVPIFLCIFIGYQLDHYFQTGGWFFVFLILGILSAFRNVYVLTKQFYAKDKAREDAELKYLKGLKQEGRTSSQSSSSKTVNETDSKNNIVKGRLS